MRTTRIFIVLLAAVGAAWLTKLGDNGLGIDWSHVAVRNWEQYGLINLHGKMVINPGGFQADTNPESYRGHRPASLYPVYACHHMFVAIGLDPLGFYAYYAVIAAMVLLSIWWLLGGTERVFWLATIAVLTPGYVRWQTSLDPNLTAALFGFPFCAAVIALLRRPFLNGKQVAMLLALILVFSMLNWTTVFVHGMLFVTLLVLPRVPRRHLMIYAGLTFAMAGWVLLTSVISKMTGTVGSSAGLGAMLQGYGWGNEGYGLDLTTHTALLRLLSANIVGLLPLLIYLGWQGWRAGGARVASGRFFLLPPLVGAMEILGMRNYFGHHPWMSVSFILLAIVLSVAAWKDQTGGVVIVSKARLPARLMWLVLTFGYSTLVLMAAQAHNGRALALATFINEQTARSTTIVICHDTDPALAGIVWRIAFDRHLVVVPEAGEQSWAAIPAQWAVLTTNRPAGKIIGQTTLTDRTPEVVKTMLGWYSDHIAHRRAGDKLEIPGEEFFLYKPAVK